MKQSNQANSVIPIYTNDTMIAAVRRTGVALEFISDLTVTCTVVYMVMILYSDVHNKSLMPANFE